MSRQPVEQRLRRLEERTGNRIAIMWRHADEPDETAYQRWQVANPTVSLAAEDLHVIIVRLSRCGDPVVGP
ncbi:MAG: hypothetical protein AB7N65_12595 [Vicinamibacterales bacterium]